MRVNWITQRTKRLRGTLAFPSTLDRLLLEKRRSFGDSKIYDQKLKTPKTWYHIAELQKIQAIDSEKKKTNKQAKHLFKQFIQKENNSAWKEFCSIFQLNRNKKSKKETLPVKHRAVITCFYYIYFHSYFWRTTRETMILGNNLENIWAVCIDDTSLEQIDAIDCFAYP